MMKVSQLRQEFTKFFASKKHEHVSSSDLIAAGDPTLLFVNSGMVQFKDVFAGTEERSYNRAVTVQKSMRVAGKHNDLDAIGRTRRHHTFFEMMGNFSFGDYFKKDAIKWAWEFLTEVIKLDASKLWVSVHEGDEDAYNMWLDLKAFGPEKIVKLGDKTNLWSMGPVGPWGYCSEIFYYLGSESGSGQGVIDEDPMYLEIWNLVFMEFLRDAQGNDTRLPKQCIDTGMGLERLASVVQGKLSNYDTDEFRQIIDYIAVLASINYVGNEYEDNESSSQFLTDMSVRVLADHIRCAVFLMSEGLRPGNQEEAYVLRRILRRALRYASYLGVDDKELPACKHFNTVICDSFIARIGLKVIEVMQESYPELSKGALNILTGLKEEEERFSLTLNRGLAVLDGFIEGKSAGYELPASELFKLYDTFGFPVDIARDVLLEKEMSIDEAGFERLMLEQKERSRAKGAKINTASLESELEILETEFIGYDNLVYATHKFQVIDLGMGEDGGKRLGIVTAQSPFYYEMGGQISDTGFIVVKGVRFPVFELLKVGKALVHVTECEALQDAEQITLEVDGLRRQEIAVHHSLTHLVNYALRKVLGEHVIQKGSLVTNSYARFDFSHPSPVKSEEIKEIQSLVNGLITRGDVVVTQEMSISSAKERGALATFGEKYGEEVRVVAIKDSQELCGGTHVANTGEIGVCIITQESGISQGVRRLVFLGGRAAADYLNSLYEQNAELKDLLKVQPEEFRSSIDALIARNSSLKTEISKAQATIANLEAQLWIKNGQLLEDISGYVEVFPSKNKELSLALADQVIALDSRANFAIIASKDTNSLVVVAKSGANDIVQKLKSKLGGKGGGKSSSAFLGSLDQVDREEILAALR